MEIGFSLDDENTKEKKCKGSDIFRALDNNFQLGFITGQVWDLIDDIFTIWKNISIKNQRVKKAKRVTSLPHFSCRLDFCVHCWVVFRNMVFADGFLFLVKELGLLTNPDHWVRVLDDAGVDIMVASGGMNLYCDL
jgi:hypothetical protein